MNLKDIIIKERKNKGFSQTQLANKANVRQATISDFERGRRALRSDTLEKILKVLGLKVSSK